METYVRYNFQTGLELTKFNSVYNLIAIPIETFGRHWMFTIPEIATDILNIIDLVFVKFRVRFIENGQTAVRIP